MKTVKDLPETLNDYDIITFWKPEQPWGYFSNWYPAKVDQFPTSEHALMYGKAVLFGDMDTAYKIAEVKTPYEAKKLGRLVKGFDEQKWDKYKEKIMVDVLLKKFNQNPQLKTILLSTGDKVLIEASPLDTIWGIGMAANDKYINKPLMWNGKNILGFSLMEVRDRLK